jgi:hypothetical protein
VPGTQDPDTGPLGGLLVSAVALVAVVEMVGVFAGVVTVAADVVRTVVRRRLGGMMMFGVVDAWPGTALVILEVGLAAGMGDMIGMPTKRGTVLLVIGLDAKVSAAGLMA